MKVLLIYPNVARTLQMPMGLAYISSYLKSQGIETFLWDNTFETIDQLKEKVKKIKPDYICFTALSPDYAYVKKLAHYIKEMTDSPIIIGGPHATYLPHEVIHEKCFDTIIRGEGEYSLFQYIATKSTDVLGTWVKKEDTIFTNRMGTIPDVNKLPWPDHEMFKRHFAKKITWTENKYENSGVFITARGCPFACTYCGCKALHTLYEGQKTTRFRDIDDIISEIKVITLKYDLKSIWFTDETLTVNKNRIIELCRKYKEIKIPFSAETRADTVDEEVLVAMKEAGCDVIRMGIESGVERIRNGLYKRNMSRATIVDAFRLAKKIGLKTSSFNICGAPTETKEDIRETIALNKECGVDSGKMTVFNVFPGSEMWDYCKQNDYHIRNAYPINYYMDSNVKHETLSIKDLMGLRREFVDMLDGFTGATNNGEI